jgi:lipid-A-disaccharide synthase-like uncharacterized protein
MSLWQGLGWAGNACFFSRFFIQWLDAERSGSDRATKNFWLLSLAGSALLGTYTAHSGHTVLVVGFMTNGLLYLRNLEIVMRPRMTRRVSSRPIALVALLSVAVLVAASVADAATAPLRRSHQVARVRSRRPGNLGKPFRAPVVVLRARRSQSFSGSVLGRELDGQSIAARVRDSPSRRSSHGRLVAGPIDAASEPGAGAERGLRG